MPVVGMRVNRKAVKEGSIAHTSPGISNVHINCSNFQSLFHKTAFELYYYTAAEADVHSQNTTYAPKVNVFETGKMLPAVLM